MRQWEENSLAEHWRAQVGMRQAKRLIVPGRIKPEAILNLNRKDIKLYTELVTGHCKLNYHLKKIGLVDNEICRLCKLSAETAEHILCECPAVARRRLHYLGSEALCASELGNKTPKTVVRFFDSLGLC